MSSLKKNWPMKVSLLKSKNISPHQIDYINMRSTVDAILDVVENVDDIILQITRL